MNWYISCGIFLVLINLAAFGVTGFDKWCARRRRRRVRERTLFLLALAGGSPGVWAAMYLFRHKTRHKRFVLGIPAILAAQLVALWRLAVFLAG
ncbi:MAG: DUF1294 domain-containing protein [Gemmiger sp.]